MSRYIVNLGGPVLALLAVLATGLVAGQHQRGPTDVHVLGPADDARVFEDVPPRDGDARARAALAAHPDDLALAVRVARADIFRARRDSDPRYLGYAQAALRTWWDLPVPPHEALVLRATIRQSNHEFESALADLSLALTQDPGDPQAWLTRAVLLQLRGDFAGAKDSCDRLAGQTSALVLAACRANLDGATGQAGPAYDALAAALQTAGETDPAERAWVKTLLAELAARQGRSDLAEEQYRAALAAGPPDGYLLGSYADFLLDAHRPREVIPLLASHTSADNLFLRLTEAESAALAPDAAAHREELASRYAQSRARGDRIHLREEARFMLHLRNDPRTALELARQNFDIQREPADARILLEAARAAGDRAAARPALDWMAASGIVDPILEAVRP